MNLAFGRAGVADRVTAESHAAQLARAREAGDAAEEQRLLLNPPSEHIGPAAKHRWEERSPEQKPDRYAEYEQASAAAREAGWRTRGTRRKPPRRGGGSRRST